MRDQYCPLITKGLRIRNDTEYSGALCLDQRIAEGRFRRIWSDAARTSFVSAHRVAVNQD